MPIRFGVVALALLALAACETAPAVSTGPDDTPAALIAKGTRMLELKDGAGAKTAFGRAAELDPRNFQAREGFARAALATGAFDDGLAAAQAGRELAGKDGPRRRVFVALQIDLIAAEARASWYTRGSELYWTELRADPTAWTDGPIHLAAGKIAAKAEDYPEAARLLRIAVGLGGAEAQEADRTLSRVEDIVRASLGSRGLAAIAAKTAINRADFVAVLFDDFDLGTYLGAKAPDAARPGETAADGTSDYAQLPVADKVRALHRLGLRGIEIAGGKFRPNDPVTREEFAMLAEDLVIRKTGEASLSRRYIGSESPFADLSPSRASFNAMMSAISRGILSSDVRGQARPTEPVTGSAAILAMRALRGLDKQALLH